ncbi:MAG: permease [Bdellovibrionales bacterium RIFOXYD1_FULL_53_11]|nr:MAG: permease [Bdellovibrionales bacterium RIFOXYD1_FULL_53_11]
MNWKQEWKILALIVAGFLVAFFLPVGAARFDNALMESLHLLKWYAQEHVLLCLVPAFFIAGALAVFVNQAAVMKYLGANAKKLVAYSVASVSGTILAVCSCTILPLFTGIYRMGAGLGPAITFLYSGPAISVLAIILTARILGFEIGVARAVGAIVLSIVIGLLMHLIYRKEEKAKAAAQAAMPQAETTRSLAQNAAYFAAMIGILVFANWGKPDQESGFWFAVYSAKWWITCVAALLFGAALVAWFRVAWWKIAGVGFVVALFTFVIPRLSGWEVEPLVPFVIGFVGLSTITSTQEGEVQDWFVASWQFAKQILPLLLVGVLVSGFLLGRPGHEGMIPSAWVSGLVGGNSLSANLFASVVGAFMYFATLTEVPIIQGLIGSGMGKGPALALLLSGPALSLPSMLVIRGVLGTKKTIVFVSLVITFSTLAGLFYGAVSL